MNNLKIETNDMLQQVKINGVKYSYNLFSELGINGMPEGTLFKLEKRTKDNYLIIEKIHEGGLQPLRDRGHLQAMESHGDAGARPFPALHSL